MRSDTQTISIDTPPGKLLAFVADARNLPRWAIGFARAVRPDQDDWLVETSTGQVRLRIDADERTGVVDFRLRPAPGVEALAASRVIPRGPASEYVFTQFQAPGMPDELFESQYRSLLRELDNVKARFG